MTELEQFQKAMEDTDKVLSSLQNAQTPDSIQIGNVKIYRNGQVLTTTPTPLGANGHVAYVDPLLTRDIIRAVDNLLEYLKTQKEVQQKTLNKINTLLEQCRS